MHHPPLDILSLMLPWCWLFRALEESRRQNVNKTQVWTVKDLTEQTQLNKRNLNVLNFNMST